MAKDTEKGKAAKAPKGAKAAKGSEASAPAGTPRLRKRYREEVINTLMQEFSYANCMQVPHLEKITLNMGLGEAVGNPNMVKTSLEELAAIAGQKPVACKSKKAIANFKLRAGLAIGAMVTLRGDRMWEFLDRLVSVALPRVRDFKGVRKNLDGHGNYTLGLTEQYIFPEINYDKVEKVKGINVTITTSAKTDEEGKALLKHLGMPFRA